MAVEPKGRKIAFYRSPLTRENLADLNRRSNFWGFLQTLGHLGLLVLSGSAAWYAADNLPLPFLFLALFVHGTFFAFLLNGFHEFCHKSVFRSDFLNEFFLRVFSVIGMYNHIRFWASHREHHRYTLHPPDDLEVILPTFLDVKSFLKAAIVNPLGYYNRIKGVIRIARGKLHGEWENALFPESDPVKRRALFKWSRFLLLTHTSLAVVSIYFGFWMIPILIMLAPAYGFNRRDFFFK